MQSRYAKLVVKDGSGNFIQLLPETKVDGSINPNSSNPPSGAAVAAWGGTFVSKTGNEAVSGQKTFAEGPYGTSVALSGTSINLSAGSVFTKTISANTTFSISNAPTGKASQFILILENGGAYTVTWPNSVVWAGGQAPALATAGKNVLRFMTPNGTDWFGCMDGSGSGGAKEIASLDVEPTVANTSDLDNESLIFYEDNNAVTSLVSVATTGNQSINGIKTFVSGIYGGVVTLVSGQNAFDVSQGACFIKTVASDVTFSFTNVPANACCFTVILTNAGEYTITWPASVKWTGNNTPLLTENGKDVLTFITADGGTTWFGTTTCIGVTA